MVKYKCYRCGYINHHRSNFIKHLNRKNICKPIISDITIEEIRHKYKFKRVIPKSSQSHPKIKFEQKKGHPKVIPNQKNGHPKVIPNQKKKISKNYTCEFCYKKFQYKQGKSKHLKKHCKVKIEKEHKKEYWKQLFEKSEKEKKEKEMLIREKNIILIEKEKKEKEKEKLIDKLMKQIELLLTKVGNTTTINNNIIIRNLGEENISYLTNTFFRRLIDAGPYASIPRIVKKIHFNEKHPENMNLKISDKTKSYISVFEENKWKVKDRKNTIKNIVNSNFELINEKYKEVAEGFDDNKKKIYKMYKERVENNSTNSILEDTEKVILNNN